MSCDIQVELFGGDQQRSLLLYCDLKKSNTYTYYWPLLGLCHANPYFSELGLVLTKVAIESAPLVLCSPDRGPSGENRYWCQLLHKLTVSRVELPKTGLYIPEGKRKPMGQPTWSSHLSYVDGSINKIPKEELDRELIQEVMKLNQGLGLAQLQKSRVEVTVDASSTPEEREYEVELPEKNIYVESVGISELPSSIPEEDLEENAFYLRTLVEEMDLGPDLDGPDYSNTKRVSALSQREDSNEDVDQ